LLKCILFLTSGCNFTSDSKPKRLDVDWVLVTGDTTRKIENFNIKSGDKICRYVENILVQERSGWRPSVVTYAPYILIISEDNMYSLAVSPKMLVVNYKRSPESTREVQLVKAVPKKVYDDLLRLVTEKGSANEFRTYNLPCRSDFRN